MVEFFKRYISLDSIGQVATAHLCAADKYGSESEMCMDIAKKPVLAVDFPKTGEPPHRTLLLKMNGLINNPITWKGTTSQLTVANGY